MAKKATVYASPAIARKLAKATGKKTSKVTVSMQGTKDVSAFILTMKSARAATAKSTLCFD